MSAQLAKKHILARQQLPTKHKRDGKKWKKDMDMVAYFSVAQDMTKAEEENNGRLPNGYNRKMFEELKTAGVQGLTCKKLEYYCSLYKKQAMVVVLNHVPPIRDITFVSGATENFCKV